MRYNTSDHNNPLFSYVLPPLPENPLPPLPAILDQSLYDQVITHVSIQQLTRRSVMAFAKPEEGYERATDYERLEHVGDGLLESIATGIIQDLYPWLRQGGAAIIRDYLVSNQTLAQLSKFYKLPLLIIADYDSVERVQASEKIQASVLEAWIAGVFYSFISYGDGGSFSVERALEERVRVRYVGYIDHILAEKVDDDEIELSQAEEEEGEEAEVEIENELEDEQAPPRGLQPVLEPKRIDIPSSKEFKKVSPTNDLEDLISMMMVSSTIPVTITRTNTSMSTVLPSSLPKLDPASSLDPIVSNHSKSPPPNSFLNSISSEFTSVKLDRRRDACPVLVSVLGPLPPPQSAVASPAIRTKGEAYDHLVAWLTPLLTPYCQWIYTLLLAEQTKILAELPPDVPKLVIPEHWKDEDRKSQGMVQALAQHPWIKGAGHKPKYAKEPREGQRWCVFCRVHDLDGKEWIGEAVRPNAQAAKNVAAWMVYRRLGQ
ncbi:uncharacterized protein IL334_004892 [Kwoniella shivajii]|uniref:RNase III domain-containing protein n=1 Tax=Kwoniella shivajii TaxID=564305 RepID=A0ABZ1D270_9TREE|nr:hypothetical protein IL334_004892 [Kwoniella shivajii]